MRALIATALIAALLPAPAFARPKSYAVTIHRVKDGDTVELNRPLVFGQRVSIRVRGVDTPEKNGACEAERQLARRASAMTTDLIDRAGHRARVIKPSFDKYGGRFDADVILVIDGKRISLAGALISAKVAVAYDGGRKINWCAYLTPAPGP